MGVFKQSLLLIVSFILVFAWQNTILSQYTIPALGFFIFLFFLISARKQKNIIPLQGTPASSKTSNPILSTTWSIFILNTVILLFIFSTGGLSSTLFFLLYFIVFGIAFVFEPATVFVFTACSILIFIPDALRNDTMRNFIMLGSLGLISPLAFFFGQEYRKEEKQEEKIEAIKERSKDSADVIAHNVEDILKKEKQNLRPDEVEKLNNVLEETETLREEKKN